ncbi:hypothetical protein ACFW1A_11735 [Kitasatospora sp. NPDC058965]|uniref:hypothetical protein n=1 Tax=Kitasatospora sp. NPDC058965 TaxID=3346682 RepID=UPI0036AE7C2B
MSLSIIAVIVALAVAAGIVALAPDLTGRRLRLRAHRRRLVPLSPRRREESAVLLAAVQELFVDDPGRALRHTATLLDAALNEMRYPPEPAGRVEALAADYGPQLAGYRSALRVLERSRRGRVGTEEARAALLGVRELYLEVLRTGPTLRGGGDGPLRTAAAPAVPRRPARTLPRHAVR